MLGGIHVTVFYQSAGRTEMSTHAQTFLHILATPAALLGREARGDSYHHMTGSFSLIREDVEERAPAGVVNALGEMMVTRHARHMQVFDTDAPIASSIVFGGFEVEVTPLTADLEMLLGDLPFSLASAVAAFCATVTHTLRRGESFLPTAIVPGVLNDHALRIGQEHLQPHIQPDVRMFTRGFWRLRCTLMDAAVLILWRRLANNQRVPVTIGAHDEMRHHRRPFQGAMHLDLHEFAQLGRNMEVCAVVVEPHIATRRVLAQLNGMPAIGCLEAGEAHWQTEVFQLKRAFERLAEPVRQRLDRGRRDVFTTTSLEARRQVVLRRKRGGF